MGFAVEERMKVDIGGDGKFRSAVPKPSCFSSEEVRYFLRSYRTPLYSVVKKRRHDSQSRYFRWALFQQSPHEGLQHGHNLHPAERAHNSY